MIKLMHGDCLEKMNEISDKSVDMCLVDPPYQMTACEWDSIIPLEPMWRQLKRIIKPNGVIVMMASQPFTTKLISSNMEMFKYEWIWIKNSSGSFAHAKYRPMKYHENILVFANEKTTYNPQFEQYADSVKKRFYDGEQSNNRTQKIRSTNKIQGFKHQTDHKMELKRGCYPKSYQKVDTVPTCNSIRLHPTEKPVALMEYLIKTYTNEKEIVLDFAAGSFTTGIACLNLKRKFIGIEKKKEYFEMGSRRIKEHKKLIYCNLSLWEK